MPQWQEGWKAGEKITANRSFVLPVAHDQHLVDSQQGQHCVGPFCCGQGLWFEDSNNETVTKCEPVTNNNNNKNGVGHTVQKSHLNIETPQAETPQAWNDNNDYKQFKPQALHCKHAHPPTEFVSPAIIICDDDAAGFDMFVSKRLQLMSIGLMVTQLVVSTFSFVFSRFLWVWQSLDRVCTVSKRDRIWPDYFTHA